MKLIILYGPPAVGKLTVAKALEESTDFKLVHNHLMADLIVPVFGFRTPVSDRLNGIFRTLIYKTAAENNINLVSTLIYYPNPQSHKYTKDYINVVEKHFL